MLTPAQAEQLILENMPRWQREDCPLVSAHNRVLRMEVRADRDLPPFDRVTMDGFALRSAAVAAGVRKFRVQATQAAGMRAFRLGAEQDACIEIMTGAVLPEGADCVVPYEETVREGAFVQINATAEVAAGSAVHRRGSDHQADDILVQPGCRLTGREIAVAASCGYATLTVAQVPKIAVITTGDELVDVESGVAPHQIRRSNDYAVRAALIAAGYGQISRFHLRDVPQEIEHRLWHILAEYDVLVVTGGISKGKFDYLPVELERQGVRKIFQGIAQRPGKPMWFGLSSRKTPVFALPGNPVATYTCLHRYVLPALDQASGVTRRPIQRVALGQPVTFKPKLSFLVPARLSSGPKAELVATPDPSNTSGDFGGLVGTDGFVELPAEPTEFPAGTVADFYPWS